MTHHRISGNSSHMVEVRLPLHNIETQRVRILGQSAIKYLDYVESSWKQIVIRSCWKESKKDLTMFSKLRSQRRPVIHRLLISPYLPCPHNKTKRPSRVCIFSECIDIEALSLSPVSPHSFLVSRVSSVAAPVPGASASQCGVSLWPALSQCPHSSPPPGVKTSDRSDTQETRPKWNRPCVCAKITQLMRPWSRK